MWEIVGTIETGTEEAGIPLNVGDRRGSISDWANFMRANRGAQRAAIKALTRASKAIDAKFGTQLAQEFAKNVTSGAFR